MLNATLLFDIIVCVKNDFQAILAVHYNIYNLRIIDTNLIYQHLIKTNKGFYKYINVLFLNSKINVHDVIIHNLMLLLLELFIKTRDLKTYIDHEEKQGDFINKWEGIDMILTEVGGKIIITEKKMIEYFLKYDYGISYLLFSLNTFIDKMSKLENLNQDLFKMKVS